MGLFDSIQPATKTATKPKTSGGLFDSPQVSVPVVQATAPKVIEPVVVAPFVPKPVSLKSNIPKSILDRKETLSKGTAKPKSWAERFTDLFKTESATAETIRNQQEAMEDYPAPREMITVSYTDPKTGKPATRQLPKSELTADTRYGEEDAKKKIQELNDRSAKLEAEKKAIETIKVNNKDEKAVAEYNAKIKAYNDELKNIQSKHKEVSTNLEKGIRPKGPSTRDILLGQQNYMENQLFDSPDTNFLKKAEIILNKSAYQTERGFSNVAIGGLESIKSTIEGLQWVSDASFSKLTGKEVKSSNYLAQKLDAWSTAVEKSADITDYNRNFADSLLQGAGSSASFFLPGFGIMKGASVFAKVSPKVASLFANSASTALESLAESGSVYEEVYKKTGSRDKAGAAATKVFWSNAILIFLTNKAGGIFENYSTSAIKRALIAAPSEGLQEYGQQAISNYATDRPLTEGGVEAGSIGAIVGFVTALLGHPIVAQRYNQDQYNLTQKELATSGHDLDRAIEADEMPMEKIYKNKEGELQPAYAEHTVSDLAGKLDSYQKGLGEEFKAVVDLSNPTPTNLIKQASDFLEQKALGGAGPLVMAERYGKGDKDKEVQEVIERVVDEHQKEIESFEEQNKPTANIESIHEQAIAEAQAIVTEDKKEEVASEPPADYSSRISDIIAGKTVAPIETNQEKGDKAVDTVDKSSPLYEIGEKNKVAISARAEEGGTIHIDKFESLEKNKGNFKKTLDEVIKYADENQKRITLTPGSDFGADTARLEKTFRDKGFADNPQANTQSGTLVYVPKVLRETKEEVKKDEKNIKKEEEKQSVKEIVEEISAEKQEEALADWEDNYAEQAGVRAEKISQLQKELKDAKAKERASIRAKLGELLQEDARVENEFLDKWTKPVDNPVDNDEAKEDLPIAPKQEDKKDLEKQGEKESPKEVAEKKEDKKPIKRTKEEIQAEAQKIAVKTASEEDFIALLQANEEWNKKHAEEINDGSVVQRLVMADLQNFVVEEKEAFVFYKRPIFNKDVQISTEEARQIILEGIGREGYTAKDLIITFSDEIINGNSAGIFYRNKFQQNIIDLYEKDGKVGLIDAIHESKHFLFSKLSEATQKEALSIAKKEMGPMYRKLLETMYKEKGVYAGETREDALLEEYIVDKWAKSDASRDQGYQKSIYGKIFDFLDKILKTIVDTFKKVSEVLSQIPNRQGGFVKNPFDKDFENIENNPENIARAFFRQNNQNVENFNDTIADAEEISDALPKSEQLAKLLEQRMVQLEVQKEWLDRNPAGQLKQYIAKSGDFKGRLPELGNTARHGSSSANLFAKEGDSIVKSVFGESGLVGADKIGVNEAEVLLEDYLKLEKEHKDARRAIRELKNEIREARGQEKDNAKFLAGIEKKIIAKLSGKQFSFPQLTKAMEKGYGKGYKMGAKEMRQSITAQLRNTFEMRIDALKRGSELRLFKNKILARDVQEAKIAQMENKFEQKVEDMERGYELSALRMKIVEHQKDAIRQDIKTYVKDNIPLDQQGKFISMVVNANTQKDLIKAFSRVDTAVDLIERKNKVAELKKSINKAMESGQIAIDYKQAIGAINASIDFVSHREATIERLQKLSDIVATQKAKGENVTIPEEILKSLDILKRKNVSELSLNEIQNISDKIELLTQLGKTKLATIERLYDIEKEKRTEALLSEVVSIEKIALDEAPIGERLTFRQKFVNSVRKALNVVRKADLALTPMDVFFDMLGGKTGTYQSSPSRIFKSTLDQKYGDYSRDKYRITDPITDLADRLKLEDVNFERIGVYGARQQKNGMEKMIASGYTEKEVNDIKLSKPEMEFYQAIRKALDDLRPRIAEVMRVLYNAPLGEVENYLPFMTDFEAMSELEVFERMADRPFEFTAPGKNVEKGFTKERKGGKQKIKLNAMEIFLTHVDNATYLVNMQRDIKMLAEIAKTEEFKSQAGELGTLITQQWLDLMAKKGGKSGNEKIAFLDQLRRNVGMAYLGFKLSSAVIQPTALFDGASQIGTWAFRGAADITRKSVRQFVFNNFPEIRERVGDDPAFLIGFENETLEKVREAGYWTLKQLDGLTASSVVWGAYMQKMSELGLEANTETVNKEALTYAQRILRITQASTLFKDTPLAMTRGALTGNKSFDKALLQFQTFVLNRFYNIRYNLIQTGVMKGDVKKSARMFMWLSFAYLAEEGLRRMTKNIISGIFGDDDDEEKEADSYIKSVFMNSLSTVPFVSQAMSVAVYDGDFVPGFGAPRTFFKGIDTFLTAKNKSSKLRAVVDVFEGIGASSGIPGTKQLGQILKDLIGYKTDKEAIHDDSIKEAKEAWEKSEKTSSDAKVITKKLAEDIYGPELTDLKENNVRKEFAIYRVFGDDKKALKLYGADSNKDKVELLKEYRQEMGPEAFREWFNKGRKSITLKSGNDSPILISDDLKELYLKEQ